MSHPKNLAGDWHMAEADRTIELQELIDRIQAGDAQARRLLLERAYDRLSRLANRILTRSFPSVQARHDVHSVVHETWLRLLQAMEKTQPPTVADFFRLAAHKIRHVLLDLVDRQRKLASREALGMGNDSSKKNAPCIANNTYDPSKLAVWTDFHQRVEQLSDEERAVFEMHYYLDMPQVEIAKVLNLHARKVSYLWVAATEKLAESLGDGIT
jgi:RNA polymerase sigma factor (sigma-70 family)